MGATWPYNQKETMHKLLQKVPRPIQSEDENKLNLERIITDVSALMSIASMPSGRGRLATSVSMASASLSVASIVSNVYRYVQRKAHSGQFTLKLSENDQMFRIAENWLMQALPEDQKLAVFMHSWIYVPDGTSERTLRYRITYDGSIEQELEIKGHKVRVATEKPEADMKSSEASRSFRTTERAIVFTCPSAVARDAVRDALLDESVELAKSLPGLYTTRWGSFNRIADISDRPVDSVFLKEGQMERIIAHLQRFLSNRDEYKRYGIPFRTGMMMYGTPGSGKTSTATVIANVLNMDIYYISIRAMAGDQEFEETVAKVPRNSIVILEDIDAVNATKDRDTENTSTEFANDVSMPSLLNVLDGMQSPEGVIFIMTTNKRDSMDDAILRPGRVDLMEELDALDTFQLRSMLSYFTGDDFHNKDLYVPSIVPADGITSAEISQIVRANINTPEEYYSAIVDHVEGRLLTKLKN